jgi:predicted CoA-substrate-specific enzyme activase
VAILRKHNGGAPEIVATASVKTGARLEEAAHEALTLARHDGHVDEAEVDYVATTGFGRYSISQRDVQATEITSGARAASFFFPGESTVLDVGSQSTRAIKVGEGGRVLTFKMNDKCAAGSGSFIVRAAKYLQVDIETVGDLALRATSPQPISSVCAVLAESEIINHVSAGVSIEDIMRGIYDSLADRAAMLLKRAGHSGPLVLIGGVARQRGLVRALEDRLQVEVRIPEATEHACAVGAALLGLRRLERNGDRRALA